MGDNILCMKQVASQRNVEIDWRDAGAAKIKYTLGKIPRVLEIKLRDLMKSLNITFATVDIAEDADGNHFFLDLNSGGQFLYCEYLVPELNLLAEFVNFLCSSAQIDLDRNRKEILESKVSYKQFRDCIADGVFLNESDDLSYSIADFSYIITTDNINDVKEKLIVGHS